MELHSSWKWVFFYWVTIEFQGQLQTTFFLVMGNNQGGYGVVCKMQIKRFDCIPNIIETLKRNDKQKACKQWLVEILACMC
jgi:hypothetical protein